MPTLDSKATPTLSKAQPRLAKSIPTRPTQTTPTPAACSRHPYLPQPCVAGVGVAPSHIYLNHTHTAMTVPARSTTAVMDRPISAKPTPASPVPAMAMSVMLYCQPRPRLPCRPIMPTWAMPKYATFSFSFFGAVKKVAVQLLFSEDCSAGNFKIP
jgi:hypothetical protein